MLYAVFLILYMSESVDEYHKKLSKYLILIDNNI